MPEATVTEERLTHERARELIERNYALLNERDPDAVAKIFTEDAVFEDDGWHKVMHGHRDIEEFVQALWRASSDLDFEMIDGPYLSEDGRSAAFRIRVTGTHDGPLDPPGFAPTGGRLKLEFGGFYEFEGDRVSRERVILNMNDAAIQIGAAPPPGTAGEKVGVFLQRLQAARKRRSSGS